MRSPFVLCEMVRPASTDLLADPRARNSHRRDIFLVEQFRNCFLIARKLFAARPPCLYARAKTCPARTPALVLAGSFMLCPQTKGSHRSLGRLPVGPTKKDPTIAFALARSFRPTSRSRFNDVRDLIVCVVHRLR
jgi:hypothetical protein